MPEWYPLMVAARWMGVKPWELEQQDVMWMNRARVIMREQQAAFAHRVDSVPREHEAVQTAALLAMTLFE